MISDDLGQAATTVAANALPTTEVVAGWRSALGASTVLWSNGGHHVVESGRWITISGANSVDFNVALCHGPEGARDITRSLEEVRAAGVPAVIMVAGSALGMTNLLAAEGWVCVGAKAFMVMTNLPYDLDTGARRLLPNELPRVHDMLSDAFDIARPVAELAIPSVSADTPARAAWGLFQRDQLVSCVGVVTIDRTVATWSLATPANLRRRGFGRRLMSTVLAAHRREGATTAMHYASPLGVSMYQALGFRVVEHWQVWSRPRWAFPPV